VDDAMQTALDHIASEQARGRTLREIMDAVGHPDAAKEGLTMCAYTLAEIWRGLQKFPEVHG